MASNSQKEVQKEKHGYIQEARADDAVTEKAKVTVVHWNKRLYAVVMETLLKHCLFIIEGKRRGE